MNQKFTKYNLSFTSNVYLLKYTKIQKGLYEFQFAHLNKDFPLRDIEMSLSLYELE